MTMAGVGAIRLRCLGSPDISFPGSPEYSNDLEDLSRWAEQKRQEKSPVILRCGAELRDRRSGGDDIHERIPRVEARLGIVVRLMSFYL